MISHADHSLALPQGQEESDRLARLHGLLMHSEADLARGRVRRIPACPRFYAPRVVHQATLWLQRARHSPLLLYLQGATLGVGLTTLLADFAADVQALGAEGTFPVVRLTLLPGMGSRRQFLDALSDETGGEIGPSNLRLRSPSRLAKQILFAFAALRVRIVIVDHAEALEDPARKILAYLIHMSDPRNSRSVIGPNQRASISYVFASDQRPQQVLKRALGIKLSVDPIYLRPYRAEDTAAVIPQLDFGHSVIDLADADHEEMVGAILRATRGQVARMEALFRIILAIRPAGRALSARIVEYAAHYTRGITNLAWEELTAPEFPWEPSTRYHISLPGERTPVPEVRIPSLPDPPSLTRAKKLRRDQARAESYRRAATNRRPDRNRVPEP